MTDVGLQTEQVHPGSVEELAEILAKASADERRVLIWGGGTHQGYGYPVDPDLVVVTDWLNQIVAWEPEDLTVVVEGGATVASLEQQLATRGQTAVLAENSGSGTVGGALATGISGYRRARYGPTRDRILEVTLVTGDGRVVRAGGRVVKNVSGYDLGRLAVGSMGRLGVIVSACFKLWPLPPATATVTLNGPYGGEVHRPMAVLESRQGTRVYLGGTDEEVNAQLARLEGQQRSSLEWPQPPSGSWTWSLRVPPSEAGSLLSQVPDDFIHQVGIGEVTFATEGTEGMVGLREEAEGLGGRLVVTGRPPDGEFEPWGALPTGLEIQRRLTAGFDPAGILNPGRLPGRI